MTNKINTLSYTTLFRSIVGLTLADVKLKADRGIECRHVTGGEVKQVEVNAKDGWTLYAGDVADWYVERSEEHTSELQSQSNLVCRLLLEKKKKQVNETL